MQVGTKVFYNSGEGKIKAKVIQFGAENNDLSILIKVEKSAADGKLYHDGWGCYTETSPLTRPNRCKWVGVKELELRVK